jgi:hypothetical protein
MTDKSIAQDCQDKIKNFLSFLSSVCPEDRALSELVKTCDTKILPGWFLLVERMHLWLVPVMVQFRELLISKDNDENIAVKGVALARAAIAKNEFCYLEISSIVMKIVQKASYTEIVKLLRYLEYFNTVYEECCEEECVEKSEEEEECRSEDEVSNYDSDS